MTDDRDLWDHLKAMLVELAQLEPDQARQRALRRMVSRLEQRERRPASREPSD